MEYGYIDYMGSEWPDSYVDLYNRIDAEVLEMERKGWNIKMGNESNGGERHRQYNNLLDIRFNFLLKTSIILKKYNSCIKG